MCTKTEKASDSRPCAPVNPIGSPVYLTDHYLSYTNKLHDCYNCITTTAPYPVVDPHDFVWLVIQDHVGSYCVGGPNGMARDALHILPLSCCRLFAPEYIELGIWIMSLEEFLDLGFVLLKA